MSEEPREAESKRGAGSLLPRLPPPPGLKLMTVGSDCIPQRVALCKAGGGTIPINAEKANKGNKRNESDAAETEEEAPSSRGGR